MSGIAEDYELYTKSIVLYRDLDNNITNRIENRNMIMPESDVQYVRDLFDLNAEEFPDNIIFQLKIDFVPNEKFTFAQFVKFVMQLKTIWGEIRSKTKIYVMWREMDIREQTVFIADDQIDTSEFVEQYLTIWPEANSNNELI